MDSLTPAEIIDLKTKFLSKVLRLSREQLKSSISASAAWDEMHMGAYNKKIVMPYIVNELAEEGLIKREHPDGVILVRRYSDVKIIRLLEVLNNVINESSGESSFGVTLDVHGVTISGLLISRRRYYDEMYKAILQSNPSAQEWGFLFEEMKKQLPQNDEEWEVATQIGLIYVCLKDAKYVMGANLIPAQGLGLWMGKIDSIDGFMLGIIGETRQRNND